MPTNLRKRTTKLEPDDHLTVARPDQLQALSNQTRWRILGRLLVAPASVQELARSLGVAKGTIGHHVRVLEEAGLIRVVETRRVRGVVEKRYARVARQFRLPETENVAPEERLGLGTMPLRQAIAEARALVRRAKAVAPVLAEYSQEQVDAIVDAMAAAATPQAEALARLAHEETGYGVVADKIQKNKLREQFREHKLPTA